MKRQPEFDIFKGILMILVVLGHSGFAYSNVIYWFHMPLFFIISGYFFKRPVNRLELRSRLKKITLEILIPYFVFLLLLNIPLLVSAVQTSGRTFVIQIIKLVYGGKYLFLTNGTFWFMSVLLLARILFTVMSFYLSFRSVSILVLLCYLLATCESYWLHLQPSTIINFPFNSDVVLLALPLYYLGYLLNHKKMSPGNATLAFSLMGITLLLYVNFQMHVIYETDMKYEVYYQPVLNVIVPLMFGVLLYRISVKAVVVPYLSNVLSHIGKNSLLIMYLHIFINAWLFKWLGISQNVILFMTFGLTIPLLLNFFIQKNAVARRLLIGT